MAESIQVVKTTLNDQLTEETKIVNYKIIHKYNNNKIIFFRERRRQEDWKMIYPKLKFG